MNKIYSTLVASGERSGGLARQFATHYQPTMLYTSIAAMTLFAVPWLILNFVKLLLAQGPWGAVDLSFRYKEVQLWFSGSPVYAEQAHAIHAVYPPASYAILWPLMGWLEFSHARIVAAVLMAVAVGWLTILLVRESSAETRLKRTFVALLLLSMYATGFSIGHGQLTIYTMWGLVTGLLLMSPGMKGWRNDLAAALLFLIALVKPSLSVPFFWIVCFRPGSLRPAVLVIAGYLCLTLIAVGFQNFDFAGLAQAWLVRSVEGAAREAAGGGYGNLHSWLAALGLRNWSVAASLLVLLALGFWTYRYRHADLWLLLGVGAIVSRLWVYHRSYDDVFILIPMIALFRIANCDRKNNRYALFAGLILACSVMTMFVPALVFVVPVWKSVLKNSQSVFPITMLMFLLFWTWRERWTLLSHAR
jgi:hypothetical protein